MARFDRIYQGLDFGFGADPAAYEKCIYDRTRKRLFLFGEVYGTGWGIPDWLARLKV